MSGDFEGRTGGKGRLAREFRLFGTIGVLVLLAFGAIQIWQISLASGRAVVAVVPEKDPTSAGQSTAEWLLGLVALEFHLPDQTEPALVLPPGTTEGDFTVRGRALRGLVSDGRVTASARVEGSAVPALSFPIALTSHQDGRMVFTLSEDKAIEFQNRTVGAMVALQDVSGVMARNLRASGVGQLSERTDRRGVYDLTLYADQLLLARQNGSTAISLQLQDGYEPELPEVDIPLDWFLQSDQENRVLTLPVDFSRRQASAAAPVTEPEPRAMATETPPAPDPDALRQERLGQLTRQLESALARGAFDRAETLLRQAQGQGADATTVADWTERLAQGRTGADRKTQIETLAGSIGTALAQRDWDAASRDIQAVRALDAAEPRLPIWDQTVSEGRKADAAAQQAEAERVAAPEPVAAPTIDPRRAIETVVSDYARAQTTHNMPLYAQVYPGADAQQRRTVQQAWDNSAETEFSIQVQSVEVDGDQATVDATQAVTIKPRAGQRVSSNSSIRLRLERRDDRWVILSIQGR